ncbi:MAG: DUF4190 domain-containing protein [Actinomyces sp.]|uniref:DUF4190 domain-containing protein n=1 Tax=Actinomyces sp. TaxID=29317 RepID=UPI0026DB2E21|nr:DUF4190 domain-containing protein [Actinomyces sp.]MDO4244286.1 DUF4190 domain-containing protein [Actinomyces sp.]
MSQEPGLVDPTRIVPEGFVFPGTEGLDAREIFSGPGYQAPAQRTDGAAIAALICAVLSPIPGLGLLAAILGAYALRRLRHSYATGHSLAWLGVVVGTASTVAWLTMVPLITLTS